MKTFIGIQYFRGIAAALVVLYHSMIMSAVIGYLPGPIGNFGIDIFFVISGFIMWTTTEQRGVTTGEFWLARIFRIIPIYWLFTGFIVCLMFLVPSAFIHQRKFDIGYTVESLLLIPSRNPDVGDISPLYTVGWTLMYEMFFYFIFGLALIVRNRFWRLSTLIVTFIGLVLYGLTLQNKSPFTHTYTNPLLLEFLAGILIGVGVKKLERISIKYGLSLLGVSIVLFAWGWLNESIVQRVVAFGPAATVMIAAVVILEKVFAKKVNKFALLIGNASYSIYLAHPLAQRAWYVLMVYMMGVISTKSEAIIYSVGAIFAGIIGGLVCYISVERPLVNRKKKFRFLVGGKRTA